MARRIVSKCLSGKLQGRNRSILRDEVRVKKRALQILLIVAVLLSIAACKGRESAAGSQTETMAPVAAQPDSSGTDAMTQTVDIRIVGGGQGIDRLGVADAIKDLEDFDPNAPDAAAKAQDIANRLNRS